MAQRRLGRRLPMAIVGASTVFLAVAGTVAVRQISSLTREKVERAALDLVTLRASEITRFFAERGRVVEAMLANPPLRRWFEGYSEFRRPLDGDPAYNDVHGCFQALVATDPTIVSAFFATATTGEYFQAGGRVEREGYDTRARWWWVEALERDRLYVTSPGVDAGSGRTMVTVQRPVFRSDGELLGVGGIDVAVDTLGRLVRTITLDGQGSAFLVERSSRVISFPGTRLQPGEPGDRLDLFLAELDRREVGNDGFAHLAEVVGGGKAGFARVRWRGQPRIVVLAPVRCYSPRLDWEVGLMLPERVITGAIRRTQAVTAFAILLAVAAIAGVTLVTTRRVDLLLMDEERRRAVALAEANARLREADHMKSNFLATMSHELRTPLNSVIGFAQVLRSRLEGQVSARYLRFLDNIVSSGEHLLAMISDILDLSKVEAGRLELHPELFDVRQVIEGVCTIVRGAAAKRGIRIVVDSPEQLSPLEADPVRLKQIVFNLLSNAVKFSHEGGTVKVELRDLDAGESPLGEEAAQVAVLDRGIGIARSDHELIFEAFRQTDTGKGTHHEGTGLGLALVRRLVGLHRGEILVDSEPGRGSTFTVTLPRRFEGQTVASGAWPALTTAVEGPLVLVVEDDDEAFGTIGATLAGAGFRVARSVDGSDAVELARRLSPAVLILDLVLPLADGWTVLRQLKETQATAQLPVVIVSVQPNRELGLALGADAYFSKPLDPERFLSRVLELSPATASGRLLVIDDDPAVHDLVDEVLGGVGYSIEHARSGDDGLSRARSRPPDLIVLDLLMDGMSGFRVAEELRRDRRTQGVPVVVLTALEPTAQDRARLRGSVESLVRKGEGGMVRLVSVVRETLARERRRASNSGAVVRFPAEV